jgi:hypothetical protein
MCCSVLRIDHDLPFKATPCASFEFNTDISLAPCVTRDFWERSVHLLLEIEHETFRQSLRARRSVMQEPRALVAEYSIYSWFRESLVEVVPP